MKLYDVKVRLVCPSDWTEEDAKSYVERIVSTKEEKESIEVRKVEE